jgi:dipeptidyl aminopeptidase/acylaminoacyl peptidase
MNNLCKIILAFIFSTAISLSHLAYTQTTLSPADLLSLKAASVSDLSPDSEELIYVVYTPRGPNEEPGSSHRTYWKMNLKTKESKSLFEEEIKGSSPHFSPDGNYISFTYKKEGEKKQVWAMPTEGGELKRLTNADNGVLSYGWQPDGKGIVYISSEAKTTKEIELEERGYNFIYFEENIKKNHLFYTKLDKKLSATETIELLPDLHVWDFEFSSDSKLLALSTSEENLIDHKYMFRKIKILDLASGKIIHEVPNEGKLGNYTFNENGTHLAYSGAKNINDHAVSQAYTCALKDKTITNHTPSNFAGHVSWVGWNDNEELYFYSGEGVYPKLSTVSIVGGDRVVVLDAKETRVIFGTPIIGAKGKTFVFTGTTPNDYYNIYTWNGKGDLKRVSDLNPVLAERQLGEQEVFKFKARDGLEIEGILMKPFGYKEGEKYPLVLYVHGGPESHHSNGWLSRYATPGQVMAGKGYLVAYINYRASTGYGVDFAMEGFGDPAGKEFDDLADGIDYLVSEKGADRERVGMAGGSYGGYASAWFATYYTEKVKAVCVFVGISNLISKRGTTDIGYEEMLVHSGKPLEEQWQMNLERSPIYYAHQSKTATLIIGGAADTRVHPEQSFQLFRRMKMNEHPAVRLVQYPGEGHGNRMQVGRIDVLNRQMQWMDWYVKDLKPINGPMPALDISSSYGLDW